MDDVRATPPRIAILALASLALGALEGCTFVGLGIGAAIPNFERVAVEQAPSIPKDTEVAIRSSVLVEVDGRPTVDVSGQVDRVEEGKLLLRSAWFPEGVARIPLDKIRTLDVQKNTYWAVGLGVGVVMDALLVTTAILINHAQAMAAAGGGAAVSSSP